MADPDFVVAILARLRRFAPAGQPRCARSAASRSSFTSCAARKARARAMWVATDDARIADAVADSGAKGGDDRPRARVRQRPPGRMRAHRRLGGRRHRGEPARATSHSRRPAAFAVANALACSGAPMATLATPVEDAATLFDPNAVRLVRANNGDALYFSRAPVPWARDAFAADRDALPAGDAWLRHIGIYAYRVGFLRAFAALPPSTLERVESLEQLRALENGHRIAVELAPNRSRPASTRPKTWRGPKRGSPARMAEPLRLLMLCMGNICRSPMAEAQRAAAQSGDGRRSAGRFGRHRRLACRRSARSARDRHRGRAWGGHRDAARAPAAKCRRFRPLRLDPVRGPRQPVAGAGAQAGDQPWAPGLLSWSGPAGAARREGAGPYAGGPRISPAPGPLWMTRPCASSRAYAPDRCRTGRRMAKREPAPAFDGKAFVARLSTAPGVYRMLAADGGVLYVGKAGALRKRVASYFNNAPKSPRARRRCWPRSRA